MSCFGNIISLSNVFRLKIEDNKDQTDDSIVSMIRLDWKYYSFFTECWTSKSVIYIKTGFKELLIQNI